MCRRSFTSFLRAATWSSRWTMKRRRFPQKKKPASKRRWKRTARAASSTPARPRNHRRRSRALKITCTEEAIADVVDAITYLTSEIRRPLQSSTTTSREVGRFSFGFDFQRNRGVEGISPVRRAPEHVGSLSRPGVAADSGLVLRGSTSLLRHIERRGSAGAAERTRHVGTDGRRLPALCFVGWSR